MLPIFHTSNELFYGFQNLLVGPVGQGRLPRLKVLHLILDNHSTHAPKQLACWIASLQLSSRGISSPVTTPVSSLGRSRPYNGRRRQVECTDGSGVPIYASALRCESIPGKGLLARADSWRQFLQLDA